MRALRLALFFFVLLLFFLTQHYEFAFVGCVVVVVFHIFHKFHPQLYNQWTLGSFFTIGLYLLITPLLINQSLPMLLLALVIIAVCGYYIFFERYLFFFFAVSLSTGIFFVMSVSAPYDMLQVILMWLLGTVFAYVVIRFDHYLVLPNLARNHVHAEITTYLCNGTRFLLDRLSYLTTNERRYMTSEGPLPERHLNIGLLLNVLRLECRSLRPVFPAYQALHKELKVFRYALREVYRLSERFDSPVLPENARWVEVIQQECVNFYQAMQHALMQRCESSFNFHTLHEAIAALEANCADPEMQKKLHHVSAERIQAWRNILVAYTGVAHAMSRMLDLVNDIVIGKAHKADRVVTSAPLTIPFQLDAMQFSLRYIIGLVVIVLFNIEFGWFGGAETALQAVISFIVIMWRPHIGRSIRFAWYRLLGVGVGVVLGTSVLGMHVLIASDVLFFVLIFLAVLWMSYICLTEDKYGYMGLQIMIVFTIIVLMNYGTTTSLDAAFLRIQGMVEGVFIAVVVLLVFWQRNPIHQIERIAATISTLQHQWFVALATQPSDSISEQVDQYLLDIETRYLVARDIVNDIQYVRFAYKQQGVVIQHTVDQLHQLTSAIKSFEQACFRLDCRQWYDASPSALRGVLDQLVSKWQQADLPQIEASLIASLPHDTQAPGHHARLSIALVDIVRLLKKER